ncbi:hypothetical protein [Rhodopseudomonas sp. BAL398]
MANAPREDRILQLYIRLLDGGAMSRYLTERAAGGGCHPCPRPAGTFCLRNGTRPLLMVASGTGVAPMVSMLQQMIATADDCPVTLSFG